MTRTCFTLAWLLLLVTAAAAQTPIHDIQYVTDPVTDDSSPLVGQTVTVQGLVTFEPMSHGGNQFYLADGGGAWNGIKIYTGNESYHLGWGWEVEVTGVVDEYFGLTEIIADQPGAVTVLDDRPDPASYWHGVYNNIYPELVYNPVPAGDLSLPNTAEAWEGCLVRIADQVQVLSLPDDFGEWVVDDAADQTVKIDNPASSEYGYLHHVLPGQSYNRVQGVLNYTFSEYKLLPEIAWDLEVLVNQGQGFYTQMPYFQQVRPMDMTLRTDNTGDPFTWDHSYASRVRYGLSQGGGDGYGEDVTVRAVISYPTALGYAGGGAKFIMTDWLVGDTHEPWSSVLSYNPDPFVYGELFLGDEVVFYGEVGEYSTGPSNMTELWMTDPFEFISENNTLPAPAVVPVSDLRDPMTAEPWGNVTIEVTDVIVTELEPTPYELFAVDDDPDDDIGPVKVDDDSEAMNNYPDPPQDAMISSMTGWVYHHFGTLDEDVNNLDWVYKICPLYPEDIVFGMTAPQFGDVYHNFDITDPGQPVSVFATVTDADDDLADVTLHWRAGLNGPFSELSMQDNGDDVYEAMIPAQDMGTSVWFWITATDQAGGEARYPMDAPANLKGYWTVNELTVPHCQFTLSADGSSPYDGYIVDYVQGVVVNSPASAEHYGGDLPGPAMFIQANSPVQGWNGLLVHTNGPSPAIGTRVEIFGRIDESGEEWPFKWEGNTRVNQLLIMNTIGVDQPISFYPLDIATLNGALESFESSLVRLEDVTVVELNAYDITVEDGSGQTFLIDDDIVPPGLPYHDWFSALQPGDDISFVRGVVTFSYGTWKLEPRGMMDVGGNDELIVTVEPQTNPVILPPSGGSFSVDITVTSPAPMQVDAWTQVTHLPSLNSVVTHLFPNVGLPQGEVTAALNQVVPAMAPPGEYVYYLYLGDAPWAPVAWDWFGFDKLDDGDTLAVADWKTPEQWPVRGQFEGVRIAADDDRTLPDEFALHAPYPNPFNPTTTVTVALPESAELTVTVYNVAGREVARLAQGTRNAGEHRLVFDASALSSGLYFVRATVPGELDAVQKLMLVR